MLSAGEGEASFLKTKIVTALFFADHFLPQANAYRMAIMHGSRGVLALAEEQF
jgi:butyryl-CoA dehydrogenase